MEEKFQKMAETVLALTQDLGAERAARLQLEETIQVWEQQWDAQEASEEVPQHFIGSPSADAHAEQPPEAASYARLRGQDPWMQTASRYPEPSGEHFAPP